MAITVARILRYPVKGLSADDLERVELSPGQGVPFDRHFALALPWTTFNPDTPQWLPKTSYLMLARNARLAELRTKYDEGANSLTIDHNGECVAHAEISDAAGRAVIEEFFAEFIGDEMRDGRPHLVETPGRDFMFSDHANCVVSINNLASLRVLEQKAGAPLDPVRFRPNIVIDGADPWEEFDWVDKEIAIGDARLLVTARIDRCAATNVNPGTAERDQNLPKTLNGVFGHVDFGVYARVVKGGEVSVGDGVSA